MHFLISAHFGAVLGCLWLGNDGIEDWSALEKELEALKWEELENCCCRSRRSRQVFSVVSLFISGRLPTFVAPC